MQQAVAEHNGAAVADLPATSGQMRLAHVTDFAAAYAQTFSLVLAAEIGDNTFLLAAVMAMRHSRLVVFAGACLAQLLASLASVACGSFAAAVPATYAYYCSTALLWIFGAKMIVEGVRMRDDKDAAAAAEDAAPLRQPYDKLPSEEPSDAEGGGEKATTPEAEQSDSWCLLDEQDAETTGAEGGDGRASLVPEWGRVFARVFALTFVGELGDRSQISVMLLTLTNDKYGVLLGSVVGHCVTSAMAVVCGRFVARRVSPKVVTLVGGVLYIAFAVFTFVKAGRDSDFYS